MSAVPEVLRIYVDALKSHDVTGIGATVADDLAFVTPARTLDKTAFLGFLRALYAGFPDWRYEHDRIEVRDEGSFEQMFDAAPSVRTAIHAGPVAIGECGDARLQIVYIGDTMNVTGRLEQMTKTMDRDCLISDEVMARIDLPSGVGAEALGALPIRGRARPLAVFALTASPDRAKESLAA